MNWKLTVLGSSSALPTSDRMLSGQVLETVNSSFLFDCSEGTIFNLKKNKIKPFKIDQIFITHLHGDHYFGIFGLLNTYIMLQRQKPLTIYSPPGLKEIVNHVFNTSNKEFSFLLNFVEIEVDFADQIYENEEVIIFAIPLNHSIPTVGYLIKQKPLPKTIDKEFLASNSVSKEWILKIRNGEDFIDENGVKIDNRSITMPSIPLKSFAYIADTMYFNELSEEIKGVSLLYHEATFSDELKDEAQKKKHSTASQAAKMAANSNVESLIIGHFSTRYKNVDILMKEARKIFKNTIEAKDGLEVIF